MSKLKNLFICLLLCSVMATVFSAEAQTTDAAEAFDTSDQDPAVDSKSEASPESSTAAETVDTVVQTPVNEEDQETASESPSAATATSTEADTKIPAAESGIRKGERRPEEQLIIDLFDRPLTIGGSFESLLSFEEDLAFEEEEDDFRLFGNNLSIELFYEISETVSFFADGAIFYLKEDSESETGAERYQTWLYFEEIFESDFDIKIGAQYLSDERTWWWDDDLDGISIQYWGERWEAELAFTQGLARTSTVEDIIDPAVEDLKRTLSWVSWEHNEDHWLEFFYVMQNDDSATESVSSIVDSEQLDDTDADLQWIGLRSYGYRDMDRLGEIDYWVDTAYVDGDETIISTIESIDNSGQLVVDEVSTSAVNGWAFDLGLTWHTEFPLSPSFILGYAVGSGKLDEQGDLDTAFQQTGIQENSYYFTDVNFISYYGELLDPELSNLKIWTLGVSVPLLENTAIDLLYHQYNQYVPADFLRNAGINADPNGISKDIGREIDVIFRAMESVHWEYGITAALFQAGEAFESDSGEIAAGLTFELRYNF